jgi:hypothetical protein
LWGNELTSQTETATKYTRLPGRGHRHGFGASIFSRCRLYLGNDHVLSAEASGFTEKYKRFYFSDIQAFVTIRTKKWEKLNIILPLIIIGWFVLAVLSGAGPGRTFLASIGMIFLAAFVYHLLKGPTCHCFVVTAIQKEQLPSLGRIGLANKVIAVLSRSIEAAQGHLDRAALVESTFDPVSDTTTAIHQPLTHQTKERHHSTGMIHLITFLLLLMGGLIKGIDFVHHTREFALLSHIMFLSGSVLTIVALVKQKGSDLPHSARTLTWASVVFVWLLSFINSIISFASAIKHLKTFKGQFDFYESMLNISPLDSSFMFIYTIVTIVCSLLLATCGLIVILRHRRVSSDGVGPSEMDGPPIMGGPYQ